VKIQNIVENKSTKMKAALAGVPVKGKKIKSFGIITPENPMAAKTSAEENNKKYKSMIKDLDTAKYKYKKVQGVYGVKEKSFFIYNVSLGYLQWLANFDMFNQESFIYGENKDDGLKLQYWSKKDERETHKKTDEENHIKNEAGAKNFFTRHKSFKFNIPFKTLMENIKEAEKELNEKYDYIDDDVFNEAMRYNIEENKTEKHLWTKRCFLYETPKAKAERLIRIGK